MKSNFLKLAVLLFVVVLSACAATPRVIVEFKKHDTASVIEPVRVIVRNREPVHWGFPIFSSGDTCRLLKAGVVRVGAIAQRPEDSERMFVVNYSVNPGVVHTSEDCPSGTIFLIREGDFVRFMKYSVPDIET